MKRELGRQETQFFAYAQMRRLTTVKRGDLTGPPLKLTPAQERKLLSRLARSGMIARVWRGLYLVPPRLPLGGKWSPDETLALNTLVKARNGKYQICGPNAFNRWGFDMQVPGRLYAYNNRLFGERTIGTVQLTLIEVSDDRLGATETVTTSDGQIAVYSSRVRTLVDAVYDWSRFDSLPRAYMWIRKELAAKQVTPEELIRITLRYGNLGTIRRIGALLELDGVRPDLVRKLESRLTASASLIPWIPTRPKRGRVNRRWGVVINDQD